MSDYRLYKVRIEKEFVVAAPSEDSLSEVEASIDNLMIIHADSLMHEPCTFIIAEEIKDAGDLPKDWFTQALPYINASTYNMPSELVNKTIKEYLKDGTKQHHLEKLPSA